MFKYLFHLTKKKQKKKKEKRSIVAATCVCFNCDAEAQ